MPASSTKHSGMRGISLISIIRRNNAKHSMLHLYTNKLENKAILIVESWKNKEELLRIRTSNHVKCNHKDGFFYCIYVILQLFEDGLK